MFTGIIETTGVITAIKEKGTNVTFQIKCSLSTNFKVDQSISHSGVCLTVESVLDNTHTVTAIEETLRKTNLGSWKIGTLINIERCMQMNGRIDGHIVQGHVDTVAICTCAIDKNGSWEYGFTVDSRFGALIIEKGSISINGISLTIFDVGANNFKVAVIPYTFEYTNMQQLVQGDNVNIEFDIIGKYVNRINSIKQAG